MSTDLAPSRGNQQDPGRGRLVFGQMFEDHVNFMDCSTPANIRVYEVEEEVFAGRRPN